MGPPEYKAHGDNLESFIWLLIKRKANWGKQSQRKREECFNYVQKYINISASYHGFVNGTDKELSS